jgi:death on curing protein
MRGPVRYLTERQILLIHSIAIDETGGSHGVRDHNAVLSLVALPRQKFFGKEAYTTIFDKTAVYVRNIIGNHPFVDGNKRTAMICAAVFLENNGHIVVAPKGQVEKFALKIISQKLGVPEVAKWFKDNSSKRHASREK